MPSTEVSLLAATMASSRFSLSTRWRSKAKPLGWCWFVVQGEGQRQVLTYFSSQVFLDHSAYWAAAGSSLARKAARVGLAGRSLCVLTSISWTSPSSFLAMVSARMTLQVLGTLVDAIFKDGCGNEEMCLVRWLADILYSLMAPQCWRPVPRCEGT